VTRIWLFALLVGFIKQLRQNRVWNVLSDMKTTITTFSPGLSGVHYVPGPKIKSQAVFANFYLYMMIFEKSKTWEPLSYMLAGTRYTMQIGFVFPKNKIDQLSLLIYDLPKEYYSRFMNEIDLIIQANSELYKTNAVYHPVKIQINSLPHIPLSQSIDIQQLIDKNQSVISNFLNDGSVIFSCSLNDVTGMEKHVQIGKRLQNKNDASYFNEVSGVTNLPKTLRVNSFSGEDLNHLLLSDNDTLISNIDKFANYYRSIGSSLNKMDSKTSYFLKLALAPIGGGTGVVKLSNDKIKRIRHVLKIIKSRKEWGENCAFQITEEIISIKEEIKYDTLREEYSSPCVAFRIGDMPGDYHIIGVSDQIFFDEIKYIGSYYSKKSESKFLKQQYSNIINLLKKLQQIGLRGNSGMDFIRRYDGEYFLINDLNTLRLNGCDLRNQFIRLSLENVGISVDDLYSSDVIFDDAMRVKEVRQEILYGDFNKFLYNARRNSGILLLPNFQPYHVGGNENYSFLTIFVNTSTRKELFAEFVEKYA